MGGRHESTHTYTCLHTSYMVQTLWRSISGGITASTGPAPQYIDIFGPEWRLCGIDLTRLGHTYTNHTGVGLVRAHGGGTEVAGRVRARRGLQGDAHRGAGGGGAGGQEKAAETSQQTACTEEDRCAPYADYKQKAKERSNNNLTTPAICIDSFRGPALPWLLDPYRYSQIPSLNTHQSRYMYNGSHALALAILLLGHTKPSLRRRSVLPFPSRRASHVQLLIALSVVSLSPRCSLGHKNV